MSAAALLSDLRRRGVELTADGDQLRYRAPRGVLSPDVLADLRTHKRELLAELGAASVEGAGVTDTCEFQRLQVTWRATAQRIDADLAERGVEADRSTRQSATWLLLLLDEGWTGRWGWTEHEAKEALGALLSGRSTGRLASDARVALRDSESTQFSVHHERVR